MNYIPFASMGVERITSQPAISRFRKMYATTRQKQDILRWNTSSYTV